MHNITLEFPKGVGMTILKRDFFIANITFEMPFTVQSYVFVLFGSLSYLASDVQDNAT